MSTSEIYVPIKDINKLLDQTEYRYGTFNATAQSDDFRLNRLDKYKGKGIYENMVKWGTVWEYKNFQIPESMAVVSDYLLLRSLIAKNCSENYRMLEGKLNFEEVAFAMKPDHELLKNITRKLTEYGRNGDLTRWEAEERWTCDDPPADSRPPHYINAEKLKGLHTLIAAAAAAALIQSFAVWTFHKWRQNGKVTPKETGFDGAITQTASSIRHDGKEMTAK